MVEIFVQKLQSKNPNLYMYKQTNKKLRKQNKQQKKQKQKPKIPKGVSFQILFLESSFVCFEYFEGSALFAVVS